jgi:hypothetical protein
MLFTKKHHYHSSLPKEDVINRLTGSHVRIHNFDFEIFEKGKTLRIIPHAEQEEAITTLPITDVEMRENGDKTNVVITSKMRRLDLGGPLLIVAFCCFLLLASFVSVYVDRNRLITWSLFGISTLIFSIFYVRMQMGYYDYVRKISAYVKSKMEYNDSMASA